MVKNKKQKIKFVGPSVVILFLFIAAVYPVTAAPVDIDQDGLNDELEIKYRTDPAKPDTDGDGYPDGMEVFAGYDPLHGAAKKLDKRIEIDTKKQELSYFLGAVKQETFKVSTGRPGMATPKGEFKIDGKHPRAWSRPYKLWMPYWMSLKNGRFGIHELPEWPGGKKEGADHLGHPVSHGCIRLGVGPAKKLYQWADIGTVVKIF